MKHIRYGMLCLALIILTAGCSGKEKGTPINVYYLKPDEKALIQEECFLQGTDTQTKIKETLDALKNPRHIKDCQTTVPEAVNIEQFLLQNQILELHFNDAYADMPRSTEVLLRAAVVQTLVQLPDVEYVSFYIEDEPLRNMAGGAVGMMCEEDFIQNTGSSLKSYQEGAVRLYFASKDGTKLVEEKRGDILYNINTSVEKMVVEQLMKGPSSGRQEPTIPGTVKLLGVSVKDGICYVNFTSPFLTDGYNQKPEVAIYSIVDSIIANGNAAKVQILVNGSSDITFKGTIDLKSPLEWRADLIEE